jgi:hypothetical protein
MTTPTEARALWYAATTGGTTSEIGDAMNLGGIPTMGILLRLQDQGLVKMMWTTENGQYQWMLTPQGLDEHERRLRHAHRSAATNP